MTQSNEPATSGFVQIQTRHEIASAHNAQIARQFWIMTVSTVITLAVATIAFAVFSQVQLGLSRAQLHVLRLSRN